MYLFFCFLPPYLAHSSKQYLRTTLLNFYLDRTYLFLFSDKVMGLVFVTFWCVSPTILILFTLHFYNINIPFYFQLYSLSRLHLFYCCLSSTSQSTPSRSFRPGLRPVAFSFLVGSHPLLNLFLLGHG